MKKMKSIAALLLALLLVLGLGVAAEEETETAQLPLGLINYGLTVPTGFTDWGVSEDDLEDGNVATYVNTDIGIGIDVYTAAATEGSFESYVAACVEDFSATESEKLEIGGLEACRFLANDLYDNVNYRDIVYVINTGAYYTCLDFYWPDMENDKSETVASIVSTLAPLRMSQLRLGTSDYSVWMGEGYYASEITEEEANEGLVAYYCNDALLYDFDVYESTADYTFEEMGEQIKAAYPGSEVTLKSYNGIDAYVYEAKDEYDGVEYDTVNCLFSSENGTFIELVCWVDNPAMRYMAYAMLETLAPIEEKVSSEPMVLQVAGSDYEITLPVNFVGGAVSEDEWDDEGYIGNYYSPYSLFDFDVYQADKSKQVSDKLDAFTEADAKEYNGTEICLDEDINGITVTSYRSVETWDDITYESATYTFEDEDYFYQLVFYWQDEDAYEDVQAVMETLAPMATKEIALGTSGYTLTVREDYAEEALDLGDEDSTAVYYTSPAAGADFTVFEFNNLENRQSAVEYAKAKAEEYQAADFRCSDIYEATNGMPAAFYVAKYTDEYIDPIWMCTLVVESGENGIVEVDFLFNEQNFVSYEQVIAIINTIAQSGSEDALPDLATYAIIFSPIKNSGSIL